MARKGQGGDQERAKDDKKPAKEDKSPAAKALMDWGTWLLRIEGVPRRRHGDDDLFLGCGNYLFSARDTERNGRLQSRITGERWAARRPYEREWGYSQMGESRDFTCWRAWRISLAMVGSAGRGAQKRWGWFLAPRLPDSMPASHDVMTEPAVKRPIKNCPLLFVVKTTVG